MTGPRRPQNQPHPTQLSGTRLAWAIEALHRVGFDANASEARRWLPKIDNDIDETVITDDDLDKARRHLAKADPSKAHYSMADLWRINAKYLLLEADGRQAVRGAMKYLSKEQLLEILGLAKPPRRPRARAVKRRTDTRIA
jgi:hypothetical protein